MAILVVWASPNKDGLTAAAKDRIVLITPVYWHDLAENLKCLLDRMRRCETDHNYHLQGKQCMLIACAGGTGLGAIQCFTIYLQILTIGSYPRPEFYYIPRIVIMSPFSNSSFAQASASVKLFLLKCSIATHGQVWIPIGIG